MTRLPENSKEPIFKSIFEADTELKQYGANALSVFALSLYIGFDDVHEFAANAITEGGNDKKIDIFYLDLNEKRAVIAQSYYSMTWGKRSAPDNKASDLNTAIAWVLSASEDTIPDALKPKVIDLRRALRDGDINAIDILYIHNCYESENVHEALKTVAAHARDTVRTFEDSPDNQVAISFTEFGLQRIDELYRGTQSEILIEDWLNIPSSKYVDEESAGWKAILTTVPGNWIQNLYQQHGDRLFSANYRNYLGSTKRKGNINQQITTTANTDPRNFWVYNNGITALTYQLQLEPSIRIRGISIINGAQTTGALNEASFDSTANVKVPMRIVECTAKEIVHRIIQYNNTQNVINPADRRSNDPIQNRLRVDFANYGISYVHRRGNTRNPRNSIAATAIAAALCAFHGDPQTAYRTAPEIFLNDITYSKIFRPTISVEHIFLVRTLSTALDDLKIELKDKTTKGIATQQEQRQWDALKYTASKHLIFWLNYTSSAETI